MKIATWNVNSLKVRLAQLLDWLLASAVDVVCLQETKLTDDKFPAAALSEAGYAAAFSGQPTYNGVAILTRRASVGDPRRVVFGNPLLEDPQRRLISASVGGLRVFPQWPGGRFGRGLGQVATMVREVPGQSISCAGHLRNGRVMQQPIEHGCNERPIVGDGHCPAGA